MIDNIASIEVLREISIIIREIEDKELKHIPDQYRDTPKPIHPNH